VLPSASQLGTAATGNLTRLLKRENWSRVNHLIKTLPQTQREALSLRYGEGLSRGEIAEVLELPSSVVKSRLFEGLKKLRGHLGLLDNVDGKPAP